MSEERRKIEEFMRKYIKSETLGENDDIFALGVVNSLFAMQLVIFIEQEFMIEVDNDVIGTEEFNSIASISNYVSSKLN